MIRLAIAFIGIILTATQSLLILSKGNGVCFNSGCEVVESLTTVSPLIFNIAGLLFFFTLFMALFFARKGADLWLHISKTLLLAGLCAEAVLVFFQWEIAQTFCSYCLIILSFILLLNLLHGLRQTVVGGVLFGAILVAGYSLQWQGNDSEQTLEKGSIAFVEGQKGSGGGYLLFSKNCKHCEAVIELLAEGNSCEVRFNPIDENPGFAFPGAEMNREYNSQANRNFLKLLSIKEIPIFVTMGDDNVQIFQGETQIKKYLQESCGATNENSYSGFSSMTSDQTFVSKRNSVDQDGCSVNEDCTDDQLLKQSAELDFQN